MLLDMSVTFSSSAAVSKLVYFLLRKTEDLKSAQIVFQASS